MTILRWAVLGVALTGAAGALAQNARSVPLTPKLYTLEDAKPDAKGIHRMVVLRALNKITGRAVNVNAPVGVPVQYGSLTITAHYCHTVPPEEPPETTAFLQIDDKPAGKDASRVFSGWMFASTPGLSGLEHAVYDIWVITCRTDEPPPAAEEATASPPEGESAEGLPARPATGAPASNP